MWCHHAQLLVPGIDRIETPLPFMTGFFAHRLPSGDVRPQRVRCSSMRCRKSHSPARVPAGGRRARDHGGVVNEQDAPPRARGVLLLPSRGREGGNPGRRADPAMASDEPLP